MASLHLFRVSRSGTGVCGSLSQFSLRRARPQWHAQPDALHSNLRSSRPFTSQVDTASLQKKKQSTDKFGRTSDRTVYVTTPIFYVNAAPHIGHAYTALVADVIARWHRVRGDKVLFASGTDEHGNKVADAAKLKGLQPQAFCDNVSGTFRSMIDMLDISVDDFVRTTEERHRDTVEWLWRRLADRGHIYMGEHKGWYCRADEAFVPEKSVASDGEGGMVSVESGRSVEWLSEPNYKFRLGAMREDVHNWLSSKPSVVQPPERLNAAIEMLKSSEGMHDLSVSRLSVQAPWGIPVPTDTSHTVYVWLDALTNYLTVARHNNNIENNNNNNNDSDDANNLGEAWPASYHIVGKDILKFHTVYWPAFLTAADLPLPKQVIAHGHWLVENKKMSKSIGNVVAPSDLVDRFGVDAVRYFLLRDGGLLNDGDFSEEMLVQRANKELADVYGNLVRRCTAKLDCWPSQECLTALTDDRTCSDLLAILKALPERIDSLYRKGDIQHATLEVMTALQEANAFFQNHEPWKMSKKIRNIVANKEKDSGLEGKEERVFAEEEEKNLQMKVDAINLVILETIRVTSILLQPVVPTMVGKVLDGIGLSVEERGMTDACQSMAVSDARRLCQPIGVVFTKLELER